uniref:Uncharacterized protein n=1 Tax=Avena sativa TaxID=4498 RepID=A0ACD5WA44_AVESA
MLGRVIFCAVIAAAVLAVVLLATVSPLPRRDKASQGLSRAITVYIHPAPSAGTARHQHQHRQQGGAAHEDEQAATSAMVFRHRMTAGPETASRTVGAASGFVLPGATMSAFDTVHLAFDAPGLSGSLCVEATAARSEKKGGDREEVLRVVGGTGAFAFARGHAVLRAERGQRRLGNGGAGASSALRLELSVTSAAAG